MEVCNMDGERTVDSRNIQRKTVAQAAVVLSVIFVGVCSVMGGSGNDVSAKSTQRVIGATATLTEMNSARRTKNVGKSVRFLLKGNDGKTQWVEGIVADAVRVKSSSLKSGEVDHRYKVRLTLQWKDVREEVLVTLNDRTSMEYPLLIGRNFLQGDFLVDVDLDKDQSQSNHGG
jgi:hypothetical protein